MGADPAAFPHRLATSGQFVSVGGIDTYYERRGSGPPIILIPPGGAHTSIWRFNVGALSRTHEVWTFDLQVRATRQSLPRFHTRTGVTRGLSVIS